LREQNRERPSDDRITSRPQKIDQQRRKQQREAQPALAPVNAASWASAYASLTAEQRVAIAPLVNEWVPIEQGAGQREKRAERSSAC